MALIDTHLTIKESIEADMSKEQAETIARVVATINNQVASKSDITDLKRDISKVKDKISKLEENVCYIKNNYDQDIKWVRWLLLITVGFLLLILKEKVF